MSQYRPPDWTEGGNPKIDGVPYHNYDTESFEAGADAYEEGLKKKPSSIKVKNYTEYYGNGPVDGTWVFIPEEEGK